MKNPDAPSVRLTQMQPPKKGKSFVVGSFANSVNEIASQNSSAISPAALHARSLGVGMRAPQQAVQKKRSQNRSKVSGSAHDSMQSERRKTVLSEMPEQPSALDPNQSQSLLVTSQLHQPKKKGVSFYKFKTNKSKGKEPPKEAEFKIKLEEDKGKDPPEAKVEEGKHVQVDMPAGLSIPINITFM